ncbi:MAG: HNH endonuclease, partial [Phycisphaerae bacterium]
EDGRGPAAVGGFTPVLTEAGLLREGTTWYARYAHVATLAEEVPNPERYSEGLRYQIVVNVHERSSRARKACIAHHGCHCAICGFDFEKVYGKLGEDFIHVHHLVPLADIEDEYEVNPIKDLLPVCPNCHAMLHRTEPPYNPDTLMHLLSSGGLNGSTRND